MSVIATFNGNLGLTDGSLNVTAFNKVLASFIYTGTASSLENLSIAAAPTVIALPASPTQVVCIKNTHASQFLTVTWTHNGGASVVVQILRPGGLLLLFEPSTGDGITALTLEGSGAATTCEVLLVG